VRIVRVAACLVAILAASGCKARAALDIEIRRDGSGVLTVRTDLDRAAREAVGDPIEPVTAPFRDLDELESFFEGSRGPDLVTIERRGSHVEMTIDLAGFAHEVLGETGSALIEGAQVSSSVNPSSSDLDATLSIRAEGSFRTHNADARRDGALVWRMWPIPDRPAVVSIDLEGSASRAVPLRAAGAAGTAGLVAFVACVRFRRRRRATPRRRPVGVERSAPTATP